MVTSRIQLAAQSFSVFEYLYRDGANYKSWGVVLLTGVSSESDVTVLRECLESKEFFVAEQVGIPVLYEPLWDLSGGLTEEDHAYHEFVDLRLATKEEAVLLPVWGSVSQLLDIFRKVNRCWDCNLSPHCYT